MRRRSCWQNSDNRKINITALSLLAPVLLLLLFSSPVLAVVINPGDILVVDANSFNGNGGIFKVDPATGAQTLIATGGFLQEPVAIAIEADGRILVTDRTGLVIRVNPATGEQSVVSQHGLFVDPFGLALEANGSILVADAGYGGSGAVIRVDPATGQQTLLTSGGFLENPYGIAVEANGNIVVADNSSHVPPFTGQGGIIRVNPLLGTQTPVSIGAQPFGCPFGIHVEAGGTLLTTVFTYPPYGCAPSAIFRANPVTGEQTVVSPNSIGWNQPFGMATEPDGSILVADEGHRAIYRVNPVTGAPTLISQNGYFINPTDVARALPQAPPPESTPGSAIGGGKIDPWTGEPATDGVLAITGRVGSSTAIAAAISPIRLPEATFRFVIRFNDGDPEPSGSLTFVDSDAQMKIESRSYDVLTIKGRHASFTGTAVVNGVSVQRFQVDVDDLTPPDTQSDNPDTFSIQLLDGSYMASGYVIKGDIQVRPQFCLLRPCFP
jgi:sugar lactone lactonase YvrE